MMARAVDLIPLLYQQLASFDGDGDVVSWVVHVDRLEKVFSQVPAEGRMTPLGRLALYNAKLGGRAELLS